MMIVTDGGGCDDDSGRFQVKLAFLQDFKFCFEILRLEAMNFFRVRGEVPKELVFLFRWHNQRLITEAD